MGLMNYWKNSYEGWIIVMILSWLLGKWLLVQSVNLAPFPADAHFAVLHFAAGPLPLRGRLCIAHSFCWLFSSWDSFMPRVLWRWWCGQLTYGVPEGEEDPQWSENAVKRNARGKRGCLNASEKIYIVTKVYWMKLKNRNLLILEQIPAIFLLIFR